MLILSNLKKQYESKVVFENLNNTIQDGSIVALKGKNGVGKTTLLNIIGGLINFDGDVLFNDISLKNNFPEYISKVSFLSNESFSYQYLSLEEMIEMLYKIMSKVQKESLDRSEVNYLIELLELNEYRDVMIRNLSLGTRQKVSIVANMLDKPSIILLDEPFVNLDDRSVSNLLEYLKDYICKNRSIMIYSTHSKDSRLDEFTSDILQIEDYTTFIYKEV